MRKSEAYRLISERYIKYLTKFSKELGWVILFIWTVISDKNKVIIFLFYTQQFTVGWKYIMKLILL